MISGYRVTDVMHLAPERLATILIGGAMSIMISICICPVWAGKDLHFLVAVNIQTLAAFLDGTYTRMIRPGIEFCR